jgi:uncharacterized membrane protein
MKRIVLTFGLIAGGILAAMLLITLPFHEQIGLDAGALIGYTTMVLAFLLIFFGVRSYRDNVAGGTVRFGRAFLVGALIALVASTCYVVTWEAIYFKYGKQFVAKYQDHTLAKARAQGDDEATLAAKKAKMDEFAKLYDNVAFNAAITFLEPLPVALIVALVSAGVLSRKKGRGRDVAVGA